MAISTPAMEPASFTLPVKTKLNTNVSTLPVILQVIALAMDRRWESRVRTNISASTLQNEASCLSYRPTSHSLLSPRSCRRANGQIAPREPRHRPLVLAVFDAALAFRTVTSSTSVLPPTFSSRQQILAWTWSSSTGCNSKATSLCGGKPISFLLYLNLDLASGASKINPGRRRAATGRSNWPLTKFGECCGVLVPLHSDYDSLDVSG